MNNFFWQVVRHGRTIERTEQWRDLGRPEDSLIGTEYRGNDPGQHRGPWIVRDATDAEWLFAGTGLADGSTFGSGGIEIDKTESGSPMFAAGAFTLAGSVLGNPTVGQLLANLWDKLSQP